jgi:hypothetical protein
MDPTYADKVVAETLKAFGKVGCGIFFSFLVFSAYGFRL